jgi:hypothetical protein
MGQRVVRGVHLPEGDRLLTTALAVKRYGGLAGEVRGELTRALDHLLDVRVARVVPGGLDCFLGSPGPREEIADDLGAVPLEVPIRLEVPVADLPSPRLEGDLEHVAFDVLGKLAEPAFYALALILGSRGAAAVR